MAVRAVLFDYGHTLVDFHRTEEALLDAYRQVRDLVIETVEEHASVPEADRLVHIVSVAVDELVEVSYQERRLEELDLVAIFTEILAGVGFALPLETVRRIVTLDHLAYRTSITLPAATRTVLEELRGRGLRLGFVSNAHLLPELLREDLEHLGLAALLDGGAFSSEVGVRKPDERIFAAVLDQLGVAPADAIHVGDRVRDDVVGARAAGLRGAVLTRQWRQEDPGGDELAVIDHLDQLPDLVMRLTEDR